MNAHSLPAVESLDLAQARAEYTRLSDDILKHDPYYHQEDAPIISDADYEFFKRRALAIEERFPELKVKGGATCQVGFAPSSKLRKVTHVIPMLSLDNTLTDTEVSDFVARIRNFLSLSASTSVTFCAEPNIDGLCLSLRYGGRRL